MLLFKLINEEELATCQKKREEEEEEENILNSYCACMSRKYETQEHLTFQTQDETFQVNHHKRLQYK